MVWGYFLKLVIADRCGLYVDAVYGHIDQHNGGSYLLATLLFPFQIYGDFAGYSLIAIGTARVLGFRLMDNFRRPYLACSVGEFWHRWHISLSTWFKDYVYIPLGGNRVSRPRQYANLMVTFVLSGIWHGASWNFLCWGALHGMLLCGEKALGVGQRPCHGIGRLFRQSLTFVIVGMAWVLFRTDTLDQATRLLTGIFTHWDTPFFHLTELGVTVLSLLFLCLAEAVQEHRSAMSDTPSDSHNWIRHLCIALAIAYISLFGIFDSSQFIYFQF